MESGSSAVRATRKNSACCEGDTDSFTELGVSVERARVESGALLSTYFAISVSFVESPSARSGRPMRTDAVASAMRAGLCARSA